MAIRRKPPHPARGPLLLLFLLAALIALVIFIANSADEVPTRPIEVDVAK